MPINDSPMAIHEQMHMFLSKEDMMLMSGMAAERTLLMMENMVKAMTVATIVQWPASIPTIAVHHLVHKKTKKSGEEGEADDQGVEDPHDDGDDTDDVEVVCQLLWDLEGGARKQLPTD